MYPGSAISEEEKSTLRAGLITNFNEPVNQVSSDCLLLSWEMLVLIDSLVSFFTKYLIIIIKLQFTYCFPDRSGSEIFYHRS